MCHLPLCATEHVFVWLCVWCFPPHKQRALFAHWPLHWYIGHIERSWVWWLIACKSPTASLAEIQPQPASLPCTLAPSALSDWTTSSFRLPQFTQLPHGENLGSSTGDVLRWHSDCPKASIHQRGPFSHVSATWGTWVDGVRVDFWDPQSELEQEAWRRGRVGSPVDWPSQKAGTRLGHLLHCFSRAKQLLHGHLFQELK